MRRSLPLRWLGVAILPVGGLALLWWADRQLLDFRTIMAATFQRPEWWIVFGWLLTITAAGVMFGLAAGLARDVASKATLSATILAGVLPLAVVVHFFSFFVWEWSPLRLNSLGAFLISSGTVAVSCVILGFLLADLISGGTADEAPDSSVERIRSL